MTFDEMVFICQVLWIRDQLANQAKPKNYPNFTHPISAPNSNIPSTNNNNARGYLTPFNTTIILAQPPIIALTDQGDPMDLSASKGPRKPFTPEERKYRFDNNLCFYCGQPGHRVMDHKTTTQRINFVTPIPNVTSTATATAPFAIKISPAIQQQGKV